jgi:hypothetical protein
LEKVVWVTVVDVAIGERSDLCDEIASAGVGE